MKIYLVERNDKIDWDEYDSWVIRANNEEEAKEITGYEDVTITEVTRKGDKGLILGSFNAG
jgi:hypothetical protein